MSAKTAALSATVVLSRTKVKINFPKIAVLSATAVRFQIEVAMMSPATAALSVTGVELVKTQSKTPVKAQVGNVVECQFFKL